MLAFIYLFLKILFIYSWEREREREAETQAEGEAGSQQGAQCRTRSQDPGVTPWMEGRRSTAEPPTCPRTCFSFLKFFLFILFLLIYIFFLPSLISSSSLSSCLLISILVLWFYASISRIHILMVILSLCRIPSFLISYAFPWSWGPRIEFHTGLPAGSLLLPLPMSLLLSLCLSWINK